MTHARSRDERGDELTWMDRMDGIFWMQGFLDSGFRRNDDLGVNDGLKVGVTG